MFTKLMKNCGQGASPSPQFFSRFRPARLSVFTLAIVILIGTVLLMLPISHTGAPAWPTPPGPGPQVDVSGIAALNEQTILKQEISPETGYLEAGYPDTNYPGASYPSAGPSLGGAPLSTAFFTSVSATSVTGLIVVDTATYWSSFGKAVLLVLMEIGGLGTMTLGAVLALAVAHRLNLRQKLVVASTTGVFTHADIQGMVKRIVTYSLVIQIVCVPFIFSGLMQSGESWSAALGNSIFLAISAFNNAGFAPYTDNLMQQGTNLLVVLPIMVALILGGLGFPVLLQLWAWLRGRDRRTSTWMLNVRIVLVATVVLILGGWLLVAVAEWSNPGTLGEYSLGDKLLLSLFTAVSPRTAGFNVMDISAQSHVTWLFTDVLMFIGAGPAGTAGGIKVTTFMILVFIVYTEVRAGDAVQLFKRRIGRSVQRQAITVVMLAFVILSMATATLIALTDYRMDQLLYEVTSAAATVGLSTGITQYLPVSAQMVLCLLMFFGRIGPVTIASALALRPIERHYEYPKERPLIG